MDSQNEGPVVAPVADPKKKKKTVNGKHTSRAGVVKSVCVCMWKWLVEKRAFPI